MARRFVIIGGGPAGNQAATNAARLGAEVTLIERDIVGGAAHLWDCIPSKAMIATGGAMYDQRRAPSMGLSARCRRGRPRRARRAHLRDRGPARGLGSTAAREPGRADARGHRLAARAPHDVEVATADGDSRSRPTPSCSRTGQPAAHPGVGADRRRSGAHHPRRVSAAGAARAPRGDRLGRDGRRVRPHVLVLRLRGDACRQPPAGAAAEGPRGRGGARGRLPPSWRAALQGGPRRSAST